MAGALRKAVRRKPRGRFRLESLEPRLALDAQGATLAPDAFDLRQNGAQVEFDVLGNDRFDADYAGAKRITSASYGDQGGRIEIAEDGGSVLYTPPADFAGVETFVYAVDGRHTATVSVRIASPLADDGFQVVPNGEEVALDVLANDPFWDGYTGPGLITSVSVGSGGGEIAIAEDGRSIRYTAPTDPIADESFIYVVDGRYPARVSINVPNPLRDDPGLLQEDSDSFKAIQGDGPQSLDVLANDPFWDGYDGPRKITHVIESQLGSTVEIAADGKSLVYTAPDDLRYGRVRHDAIHYVVDGQFEATVTIRVFRPVRDDYFEVDQNSGPYLYNVLANDNFEGLDPGPPGPIDIVSLVTAVTQPEHGVVTIAPGGHGVLYTPKPGYKGPDAFTYTADGKHTAAVNVTVNRAVRNDNFRDAIFQDTPNQRLNVLANDFLGNGYAGAKVITAVGPTEAGATVTIEPGGGAVLYTPAPGHTGADRFTYTVDGELQAEVFVVVTPLTQNDSTNVRTYTLGQSFTIDLLANDYFDRGYTGPGEVTNVELVSGEADFTFQANGRLTATPTANGSLLFRYTVDGRYQGDYYLSIRSQTVGDHVVVEINSDAREVDVLSNDFRRYQHAYYGGPRIITATSEPLSGGRVTIADNGKSVFYTPAKDFYGKESFTYKVDGFWTETVTIDVFRRVRDDTFRVDQADGQQTLPVLVNDLFGSNYAGVGAITAVTPSSGGATVQIGPNGQSILYTPAAGFTGEDTFSYTVDGRLIAEVTVVVDTPAEERYGKFEGVDDYFQFLLDDALERYAHLFGQAAWNRGIETVAFDVDLNGAGPTADRTHSETNVQVAGVDEGDIVEFDADYVYALSDSGVTIFDAWPAEDLSVASRIDIEGRPLVEYLSGDRLTVISQPKPTYNHPWWYDRNSIGVDFVSDSIGLWPPYYAAPSETIVTVIDVSDRTAPVIVQTTTMDGRYVDSRSVDGQVYTLVSNSAVGEQPLVIDEDDDPSTPDRYETAEEYAARMSANRGAAIEAALPSYTTTGPDGETVRSGLLNTPETVYQPLTPDADTLISIVSIDAFADSPGLTDAAAVYSTGAGTIYASLDNFYVFDADSDPEDGAVTRIAKFDWDPASGGIDFTATTTVPGRIINQFSADESDDYLRIATTARNWSSGNYSRREENLLFVLSEDDGVFESVGSIQNWALDETIRSVRFLGDRAFVTTARTIDPLFALDLTDPTSPEAVGHVTLPGFTSYLHLVDEDHLLAVGKNTPNGRWGPTQVSLFDIADLSQPVRLAEHTFTRFSTSEAEVDHHAFGYFAEHGLLAMPVGSWSYERVDADGDGYAESRVTKRLDRLAVFSVDVDAAQRADRLTLSAEIEHDGPVRRSGYIGDKLFSVGRDAIKALDVADLSTVIATAPLYEPPTEIIGETPLLFDTFVPVGGIGSSTITPPTDPRADAIAAARANLAERLGVAPGAPLMVTSEATPDAPGGGEVVGFRVGGQTHWYRVNSKGRYEPAAAAPLAAHGGAWNAVALPGTEHQRGAAGDFNRDGAVDQEDYLIWRDAYGDWSLNTWLPADANADGRVDLADYTIWRDRHSAVAAAAAAAGESDDVESPQETALAAYAIEAPSSAKAARRLIASPTKDLAEATDDALLLIDLSIVPADADSPSESTAETGEQEASEEPDEALIPSVSTR